MSMKKIKRGEYFCCTTRVFSWESIDPQTITETLWTLNDDFSSHFNDSLWTLSDTLWTHSDTLWTQTTNLWTLTEIC